MKKSERRKICVCVFILIQTNDNIMWLHKTYETGINIKSKDYKKGMS